MCACVRVCACGRACHCYSRLHRWALLTCWLAGWLQVLTAAFAHAVVTGLQGAPAPPTPNRTSSLETGNTASFAEKIAPTSAAGVVALSTSAAAAAMVPNQSAYVAATAGCKHFGVGSGPDSIPQDRRFFDANVTLRDWATTFLPAFEVGIIRSARWCGARVCC